MLSKQSLMGLQNARGGVLMKQWKFNCFLRPSSYSSKLPNGSAEEQYEGSVVQGFQSREHEFYHARSHDIMPRTAEELEKDGHGVEDSKQNNGQPNGDGKADENMKEQLEKYERLSSVSLRSVMQSNVPEPFNPHGRNPTHLNMPGGGVKLQEKYLSSNLQKTHPSRNFSTYRGLFSQASEVQERFSYTDLPCPQGVQGYDCIQFKLWLDNCQRHNLDCDQSYDDFQSGRKTLAQLFEEQESLIKAVAKQYQTSTGPQGFQDINDTSVQKLQGKDNPSVQGIQGSDCEQFRVWLSNCNQFNLADCDNQLEAMRSGRKTLSQVFREQEEQIAKVRKLYYQQNRHYSTSPKGSNEVSNNETKPEAALTQGQKLKRAVKEYGATVVVFHVCIALTSLGGFYLAVSSGIDMVGLLQKMGVGQSILDSKVVTGASTFVVAYAVHKVFAPVRIGITLSCSPFIVRYLRNIGFLKPPKPKV